MSCVNAWNVVVAVQEQPKKTVDLRPKHEMQGAST